MTFEPIEKKRIAVQVAEAIREAILGGELEPGDELPSERKLAQRFQVNRSGVREALTKLEAWGLLEIRHGGITRVRDFLTTAGLQLLPFLVAPGGVPPPERLRDLLELRKGLMGWTAQQAAERSPGKTQRLEEIHARLVSPEATASELKQADFDFFSELVRLTGNSILRMLTHSIRQVYEKQGSLFEALYSRESFDAEPHRRVLEAVKSGAPEDAATAIIAYADRALSFFSKREQPKRKER